MPSKPSLKQRPVEEMIVELQEQLQVLSDQQQQLELSLVTLCLSRMLIVLVRLSLQLGIQFHLGVAIVHCVTHSLGLTLIL